MFGFILAGLILMAVILAFSITTPGPKQIDPVKRRK